jgi:hypothetical protein
VTGSRTLVTPSLTGGLNMATRGTIYYAFTKSHSSSVFSCETQLTWRLCLSQPNSAEWWKVQSAKIRISISLATPLSWVDADFLHQKIGTTLSLTRNHNPRQWCDTCKMRYGQMKDGTWHLKAQTPAIWKVQSETPMRRAQVRFYCQPCADEVQNWPDGTFWSLKEQLQAAIDDFAGREKLNVELPR